MQICSHCGRENADDDAYCQACGYRLLAAVEGSEGVTGQLGDEVHESSEPKRGWGTAYFDHENRLRLTVRDQGKSLLLHIEDTLIIGRSHEKPEVPLPDVDLAPFDALDLGVSRNHLAVTHDQDTIMITDLGSANGTYLNGQRLIPHEPRILRDGDELRLGRMVVRVSFV